MKKVLIVLFVVGMISLIIYVNTEEYFSIKPATNTKLVKTIIDDGRTVNQIINPKVNNTSTRASIMNANKRISAPTYIR
jgi:hypothetical protein